jgi:hypothetical protein
VNVARAVRCLADQLLAQARANFVWILIVSRESFSNSFGQGFCGVPAIRCPCSRGRRSGRSRPRNDGPWSLTLRNWRRNDTVRHVRRTRLVIGRPGSRRFRPSAHPQGADQKERIDQRGRLVPGVALCLDLLGRKQGHRHRK